MFDANESPMIKKNTKLFNVLNILEEATENRK